MGIVAAVDVTSANYDHAPAGILKCLYVTGSPDIVSTTAQRAANPDALLIDQTPVGGVWDATADVDDYENGAVSLSELPVRAKARMIAFKMGTRPGQREPAVYASQSNITPVVNELIAGGVTSGVGLWVANWSFTEAEAVADVMTASGPFPIIGFQYNNAGPYDQNVFDSGWLNNRSGKIAPSGGVPVPPGQWLDSKAFSWKDVVITGIGADDKLHTWVLEVSANVWREVF